MVQWWWCFMLTYVQEFYHFLQHQRAKSVKREYGFLHDNQPQTLSLWYLFTVTSPNMDFKTTFFGQLKKPCHALAFGILPSVLQEVVKLLYHMYMYQCVISFNHQVSTAWSLPHLATQISYQLSAAKTITRQGVYLKGFPGVLEAPRILARSGKITWNNSVWQENTCSTGWGVSNRKLALCVC